jgi:hypothetical protein
LPVSRQTSIPLKLAAPRSEVMVMFPPSTWVIHGLTRLSDAAQQDQGQQTAWFPHHGILLSGAHSHQTALQPAFDEAYRN